MEEEENSSWITRTKFSHTVYLRSGSVREKPLPFAADSDSNPEFKPKFSISDASLVPRRSNRDLISKSKRSSADSSSLPLDTRSNSLSSDSSSFSFYLDRDSELKSKNLDCSLSSTPSGITEFDAVCRNSSLFVDRIGCNSKLNQSSVSPLRSGSVREKPLPFAADSDSNPEFKPKISNSDASLVPRPSNRDLISKSKRSSADSSSLPLNTRSNSLSSDSSSFSFYSDRDSELKSKNLDCSLSSTPSGRTEFDAGCRNSSLFVDQIGRNSKSKQRSVSPLPITVLSDAFKEARLDGKRFSSPPSNRKGSNRGLFGKSSTFLSSQNLSHLSPNSLFVDQIGCNSTPKQRSVSPLPITVLSDAFKEAQMDGKRFSTPPPSRKGSNRGLFGKSSTSRSSPNLSHLRELKSSGKPVGRKEVWTVDLSELYVGHKFASGAHSRLYRGIYKDQGVAVKLIQQPDDDENGVMAVRLEKQFTREVTFLSYLNHRNVIKLAGACNKTQVFCIITEYLSGGSLRAFLHRLEHKSLPLLKVIAIALDIARGMEYIHSQGVIHRDLKPENILFDQDFCIKIADFGIACEEEYCDAFADDPGTYRWMAPEVIKHKPYGRKVDVYSFGLLLWEMIAGRIPYENMTPIQAAFAVVNKNLRPSVPAKCPAALGALIEQCWALHPEKRPEFRHIVMILEEFKSALDRDGSLDLVQNITFNDRKKRVPNWIQNFKPLHNDEPVHPIPMPKFL